MVSSSTALTTYIHLESPKSIESLSEAVLRYKIAPYLDPIDLSSMMRTSSKFLKIVTPILPPFTHDMLRQRRCFELAYDTFKHQEPLHIECDCYGISCKIMERENMQTSLFFNDWERLPPEIEKWNIQKIRIFFGNLKKEISIKKQKPQPHSLRTRIINFYKKKSRKEKKPPPYSFRFELHNYGDQYPRQGIKKFLERLIKAAKKIKERDQEKADNLLKEINGYAELLLFSDIRYQVLKEQKKMTLEILNKCFDSSSLSQEELWDEGSQRSYWYAKALLGFANEPAKTAQQKKEQSSALDLVYQIAINYLPKFFLPVEKQVEILLEYFEEIRKTDQREGDLALDNLFEIPEIKMKIQPRVYCEIAKGKAKINKQEEAGKILDSALEFIKKNIEDSLDSPSSSIKLPIKHLLIIVDTLVEINQQAKAIDVLKEMFQSIVAYQDRNRVGYLNHLDYHHVCYDIVSKLGQIESVQFFGDKTTAADKDCDRAVKAILRKIFENLELAADQEIIKSKLIAVIQANAYLMFFERERRLHRPKHEANRALDRALETIENEMNTPHILLEGAEHVAKYVAEQITQQVFELRCEIAKGKAQINRKEEAGKILDDMVDAIQNKAWPFKDLSVLEKKNILLKLSRIRIANYTFL